VEFNNLHPGVVVSTHASPHAGNLAKPLVKLSATAVGVAAAGYALYAASTWLRYGRVTRCRDEHADPLLDRFLPRYDVVERHHVLVDAPADVTFNAAQRQHLNRIPLVRCIFRARELVLRGAPSNGEMPEALLDLALSLGWVALAEVPDREIVMGAVTRPWEANVVFRGIPSEQFAAFDEPGYVKIVWSLRADRIDSRRSVFRTETRAIATDAEARGRFRVYWSLASPGIWLIRRLSLRPLKFAAEHRFRRRIAEETARALSSG
jgi:hypothetical protein